MFSHLPHDITYMSSNGFGAFALLFGILRCDLSYISVILIKNYNNWNHLKLNIMGVKHPASTPPDNLIIDKNSKSSMYRMEIEFGKTDLELTHMWPEPRMLEEWANSSTAVRLTHILYK